MLPEHLERLKIVFAEQNYKEKPILDEQQIAENELILQHAIHEKLMINVKYFKDHDLHMIQGTVSNIVDGNLRIDHLKINLKDIIEISYL